jgi:hypothetical protein
MDSSIVKELFSQLGSLTWAVVVVGIVCYFGRDIRLLIGKIKKVSIKGIDAEIESDLRKIEEKAQTESIVLIDPKLSELLTLADSSPNSALLEAWRELGLATISAALHSNLSVRGPMGRVSGSAAYESLTSTGKLSTAEVQVFESLRLLRNRAINADAIGTQTAYRYAIMALQLASRLRERFSPNSVENEDFKSS